MRNKNSQPTQHSTLSRAFQTLFMLSAAFVSNLNAEDQTLTRIVGADPDVIVVDGTYWMYPTHCILPNQQFVTDDYMAYSSKDLVHWVEHGPVLKLDDIDWWQYDGSETRFLWAPGVIERDEKFFMYYSLGPNRPIPSIIGVATADRPEGPFVDSGRPLLKGGPFKGRKFEAIDAMVFIDPKTETPYFYAGGGDGKTLRVFEMKDNLIEFEKEIDVETPPHFTEGAFMHVLNGTYYLSYSGGFWNKPSYSVHYATAKSPTGPWAYQGAVLESTDKVFGPAHHAFFKDKASDQWHIAYHYWTSLDQRGTCTGVRYLAVQPIEYDQDGNILKIEPKVHLK